MAFCLEDHLVSQWPLRRVPSFSIKISHLPVEAMKKVNISCTSPKKVIIKLETRAACIPTRFKLWAEQGTYLAYLFIWDIRASTPLYLPAILSPLPNPCPLQSSMFNPSDEALQVFQLTALLLSFDDCGCNQENILRFCNDHLRYPQIILFPSFAPCARYQMCSSTKL